MVAKVWWGQVELQAAGGYIQRMVSSTDHFMIKFILISRGFYLYWSAEGSFQLINI
jgi:hypothetical protein